MPHIWTQKPVEHQIEYDQWFDAMMVPNQVYWVHCFLLWHIGAKQAITVGNDPPRTTAT